MTPKELYEWALKNNAENENIYINYCIGKVIITDFTEEDICKTDIGIELSL